jgi:hypothetical protein
VNSIPSLRARRRGKEAAIAWIKCKSDGAKGPSKVPHDQKKYSSIHGQTGQRERNHFIPTSSFKKDSHSITAQPLHDALIAQINGCWIANDHGTTWKDDGVGHCDRKF